MGNSATEIFFKRIIESWLDISLLGYYFLFFTNSGLTYSNGPVFNYSRADLRSTGYEVPVELWSHY
jgi:hypothetical protein